MTLRIALIDETGECEIGGVRCKVVPVEPTREWCTEYLAANKEYWDIQDRQALPPLKWRNGTPAEATSYAYQAAMLSAAAIDLSGLPAVPPRSPDVASDLNYWLDEIGVKG